MILRAFRNREAMSDIHFFMTQDDTEEFIAWLIAQFRPTFIPSSHPTQEFPRLTTLPEVSNHFTGRQHCPRFSILSDVWHLHPLCFSHIHHNDGTSAFYVDQRYGGPAFDLVFSRPHSEEPNIIVGGRLGDYASYFIHPDRPDPFPRPAGMAQAFRSIQNYMRRYGRRTVSAELGHSGGWAMRGALAAHAAGTWLRLGDFHFHPTEPPKLR
jgi:hypothetical protein